MSKINLAKIVSCYIRWKLITNTKLIQVINSGSELLKGKGYLPEGKGYSPGFSIILIYPIGIICRLCGIEWSSLSCCEFYFINTNFCMVLELPKVTRA